ncbi:MAG: cyclodeaminase/cyclohydrolase family protein [Oscillospiraceae bacterium]|nr:cyclodeaminase/cyclohydrolase family protein [Oscillospiraceae bacterium]
MKLTQMTVSAFAELLGSDAPAPGGGSASALAGSLGAALTTMVAALTVGKEKYQEHDALMQEIIAAGGRLRLQLTDVIDRDTEAFNSVTAVFSMPKETDEEKAARKAAMQAALKACTLTPYEMMECSLRALELTEKALGRSNTNAASDLGVAALMLKAAVQGAWLNILINIGGIRDEDFVTQYRGGGEAILAKALPLADKIYETVLGEL